MTLKLLTEKEKKTVIHLIDIAVVIICLLIEISCLVNYKFSKLFCSNDVSLVLVYKNTA